MDFITGIPESNYFNAILDVVDHLSKMAHYLPYRDTTTTQEISRLYLEHNWKLQRLPTNIISNQGSPFTSAFWKSMCSDLNIETPFSTAFPASDGLAD